MNIMDDILFVISFVIVMNWTVIMIAGILGNSISIPAPFLHLMDWNFSNTYLSTPALMYQVYFWATYTGVIL